MRHLPTISIILLYMVLAACMFVSPSSVTVRNAASTAIEDVVVDFSGSTVVYGRIEAGETITRRSRSLRDGSLSISFTQNGRRVSEEMGYVTPQARVVCDVTVSDGPIQRRCRTA